MSKNNKSVIYLIAIALVGAGLTGCGATVGGNAGTSDSTTLESGSADGTGDSAVASDTDTSVTLTSATGSAWSEFLIDLGAQFQKANICAGKTIFGRLGTAMCPEEISAGNAFRSGSLTLADELASGTCSDADYLTRDTCEDAPANVWTPIVATGEKIATESSDDTNPATNRDTATFSYNGTSWVQTAIVGTYECGETGNIKSRINDCNRQWQATTGSKAGGGTWSLISKINLSGTYYEVWRDNKTGLIWSDNLGSGDHCEATGDIDGIANCNGTFVRSFCAETGFAIDATGISIESATGTLPTITAYDAKKGEMGMSSTNPVLWRLPTLQDYTIAYGNGMAYVLPRLGNFWTSSVNPTDAGDAMHFYVDSSGLVDSYDVNRNTDRDVRCVGR